MSLSDAFLSYTRLDDEYFGGAISALRKELEIAVKVITGDRCFSIFQDIDGIEFGQQWQNRLDQAVSESGFLIPIITPLFFSSEACRDELDKFIALEQKSGRDDTILPVYYYDTPVFERRDQRDRDDLAIEVSKRQRYDWRPYADLPFTGIEFKQQARKLAAQIGQAIARASAIRPGASPGDETEPTDRYAPPTFSREKVQLRPKVTAKVAKVLWVDDRPENNILERAAMEKYGITFVISKSTNDAQNQLKKMRFDAIISDMGRPSDQRAGYTLLKTLRSSDSKTPYFIYAGSSSPEHTREARKHGAQGSTNRATELINWVVSAVVRS